MPTNVTGCKAEQQGTSPQKWRFAVRTAPVAKQQRDARQADRPPHLHPEEGLALLPQVWQQAQQALAVRLDAVRQPLNDEIDQVEDLQAATGT